MVGEFLVASSSGVGGRSHSTSHKIDTLVLLGYRKQRNRITANRENRNQSVSANTALALTPPV